MRGLNCRRHLLTTLLLGLLAGPILGASYTWVGFGTDDDWTTAENWTATGFGSCSYPCGAGDDVWIPVKYGGGEWGNVSLDFSNLTIDDMTILDGVDFTGGLAILNVDVFTIDADDAATTVTFSSSIHFSAGG